MKLLSIIIFLFLALSFSFAQESQVKSFSGLTRPDSFVLDGDTCWIYIYDYFENFELVKFNMLTHKEEHFPGYWGNSTKMMIDKNKNIWSIGAWGIFKFDGISWIQYNEDNTGLDQEWSSFSMLDMKMDAAGQIYILSGLGILAKYDGVNWSLVDTTGSGIEKINCFSIDINSNIWVGTSNYLCKFDGKEWTRYKTPRESMWGIVFVEADPKGLIWASIDCSWFYTFDGKMWSSKPLPSPFCINSILFQGNDILYISTGDGLLKYNQSAQEWLHRGYQVNDSYIDKYGSIWFDNSFNMVISKIDSDNKILDYGFYISIPPKSITEIQFDSSGNTWIATNGAGISKFDGENWLTYDCMRTDSGLFSNYIKAFDLDSEGNLWIAASDSLEKQGALCLFDGRTWKQYTPFNSGLPHYCISSIAINKQGKKWIGTRAGLAHFDDVNWTLHLPEQVINDVKIDSKGIVWAATDNGLARYDGNNWTVFNVNNSKLPSDKICFIEIDRQDRLFFYAADLQPHAFHKFNGGDIELFLSPFPNSRIRSLAFDLKGNIWLGCGSGIAKYNGLIWCTYDNILPHNNIEMMSINANDDLWVSTCSKLFDGYYLSYFNTNGLVSALDHKDNVLPAYELSQNYPNPFNPVTTIQYFVTKPSNVKITLYDVLGNQAVLLLNEYKNTGQYSLELNASHLPSGVYLYRMESGSFSETKKLILLK